MFGSTAREASVKQSHSFTKWLFAGDLRPILAVILVACVLTLTNLGRNPLSSKGEPREALVAQAILQTGNWILPARYGDQFATKPPLVHWLMAIASLPEGRVTEWSARLPSALASIAALIGLYLLVAARSSREHALLSCLLLLGSIEWFRASVGCRVDLILKCDALLRAL